MADRASNFRAAMEQTWRAAKPTKSRNANERAEDLGAVRLGSAPPQPGFDVPASLWQFPDGSRTLIANNGTAAFPLHGRKPRHATARASDAFAPLTVPVDVLRPETLVRIVRDLEEGNRDTSEARSVLDALVGGECAARLIVSAEA